MRGASGEERARAVPVFFECMARHANGRLAAPMLRTLLFLVQGPLAASGEFRAKLLEQLRAQVKGCTDVPRLLLMVDCAAALTPPSDDTAVAAKGALLFFLTHAYPKLRVAAADALLQRLTDADAEARPAPPTLTPHSPAQAQAALVSAPWAAGPLSALQPVRHRLHELLRVPRPAPAAASPKAPAPEPAGH